MNKWNNTVAAGVLVGLGAFYMVVSLASGHEVHSEPPPDLTPQQGQIALDVWKAAALLATTGSKLTVLDLRPESEYALAHVPGARNEPGAGASRVAELAARGPVLLITTKDEEAQKIARKTLAENAAAPLHYLTGGARAWYLTFELPVALFSEKPAPRGYEAAIETVRTYFANPAGAKAGATLAALQTLARLDYQPTLLKQTGKPKTTKKRKKISGGCG